jgi:hypothetical protein
MTIGRTAVKTVAGGNSGKQYLLPNYGFLD